MNRWCYWVRSMAQALSLFDPQAEISFEGVALRDAMSCVLQLRGKGQRARNVTDAVWEELDSCAEQ